MNGNTQLLKLLAVMHLFGDRAEGLLMHDRHATLRMLPAIARTSIHAPKLYIICTGKRKFNKININRRRASECCEPIRA